MKVPIKNPSPDFENFKKILKGEKKPERVHFVELALDLEVMKHIIENIFEEKWIPYTEETKKQHIQQTINFFYKMGYDFVPGWLGFKNMPEFKSRQTDDTAGIDIIFSTYIWYNKKHE